MTKSLWPDLLVVGRNLETSREVAIDDRPLADWRELGYGRREVLVCSLCYAGIDAPRGTRVPLVVRGRAGGNRRPHFAHPAGTAPESGGHEAESVWHFNAKITLRNWAAGQQRVTAAEVERWLPDRARRSDILVTFNTGARVAIEVQSSQLTDDQWLARHQDYQAAGIQDLWLWRKTSWIPWIVPLHGQHLWYFDPAGPTLVAALATGHHREGLWWQDDPTKYAIHSPPCLNDGLTYCQVPLNTATLQSNRIVAREITNNLTDSHASVEQEAVAARRRHDHQIDGARRRRRANPGAAQPPTHLLDSSASPTAQRIRRLYYSRWLAAQERRSDDHEIN